MPAHLSINDSEPMIGASPLALSNPLPVLEPPRSMQPLELFYRLQERIYALEARVTELESRTWWSMLKAQVRTWLNRS